MSEPSSVSLCSLGVATRVAFQKALRGDLHLDDEIRQQVTVESERFELWATNLGLFVAGHGSLDYRTRQAENIKGMLHRFLSALVSSLSEVVEYAETQTQSLIDDKAPLNRTSSDDGWEDDESDLDLLISSIRDPVDRLYKLSTWIRNPSSRFTSPKALQHTKVDLDTNVDLLRAYQPFDEDYITSLFSEYQSEKARTEDVRESFEASTEDDFEPVRTVQSENNDNLNSDNAYLIARLVRANFRRRQLFSYWKRHHEKLTLYSTSREESVNAGNPAARHGPPLTEQQIPNHGLIPLAAVPQSVTTATLLKTPQQLVIRDDRSTVSVSMYGPSMYKPDKEPVQFPRPPSISPDDKFFECPFCYTICPKAMLAEGAWEAHLIHDIRPYVCTYRDCGHADELYDNRRDWLQHENFQHRSIFRCPDHPDHTYDSIQDYHRHIKDGHRETFAGIPQDVLRHASESTSHLPDRCCPICSISLETQTGMQIHIARHLERVALFSLPRYVDMDEQNASGQGSELAEAGADGSRNDDFEGHLDGSVSVAVLDEAIQNARQAVDISPADHPDRAARLDNLGSYLSNRYSRTGATSDLQEAINIARQVVHITPKDHPDRAARLDNLRSYLLYDSEEVPVEDSARNAVSIRDDENLPMRLHDSELLDHSDLSHRQDPLNYVQDPMDYDSEMPPIPDLRPDDIIIAVMGATGCGKTTFINLFSDRKLKVGYGLDSCTASVEVVPCTFEGGAKIYLVDTPGFDDTYRTDSEILREVALWLNKAHSEKLRLAGIIFLQRISDVRVGGSGIRNIRMFQKLCGDGPLGSVVLATTMWDMATKDAAIQREKELKEQPQLWKRMIDHGSVVFRHDNKEASALKIIKYLMRKKRPVTLDIQREMVDEKRELIDTGAGEALASNMEALIKLYEGKLRNLEQEIKEARKEDREMLEEQKREHEENLAKQRKEMERLHVSRLQLTEEQKKQFEESQRKTEEEMRPAQEDSAAGLERQRKQITENWMRENRCIVM